MLINIPSYVKDVMAYLEDKGFEVFAVGGCVRDSMLGGKPYDWDLCTNATPDEMIKVLNEQFLVVPTGLKHGTVTVVVEKKHIEITTYRTDGLYTDGRHPTNVDFVKRIDEDLRRRDFTINAMAYNDKLGIIDIFDGIKDLKNGIIRCVGNPIERFSEDALRIMRCVRFASVLGFEIENETQKALFDHKDKLNKISAERILDELKKIVLSDTPYHILSKYIDVFSVALSVDLDIDSFKFINDVPQKLNLRLASLLCKFDVEKVSDILRGLRVDSQTRKDVCALIENKDRPISFNNDIKHLMRVFGADITRDIAKFSGKYTGASNKDIEKSLFYINEVLERGECYQLSQLDINGCDLVERGFKGREISACLNRLLDDVIDGKVRNNRIDLLANL